MDRESEILRQALDLIRAGRPQEAVPRLMAVVKANPQSAQAWLLLSTALTDPKQQRDCLERVLKISPDNIEAALRLAKLEDQAAAPPRLTHQRPAPSVKASPFTGLDEADLQPLPAAASAPPQSPVFDAPQPVASDSPTDWLARLNADTPPQKPAASASEPPSSLPAQKPAPPASPPATPRRQAGQPWQSRPVEIALISLLVLSVVGCGLAALFAVPAYLAQLGAPVPTALPTSSPAPYPTFPPAWTPTPGGDTPTPLVTSASAGDLPSATPAPPDAPTMPGAPTPTRAPTQPPTPNSTMRSTMDTIQQQVADVRGLAIEGDVPRYLISKYRLETTARGLLVSPDYQTELKSMALVYTTLGLIKPTYDLVKYALNSQVDSIGGFYVPWTKQLFVVGDKFTGLEHYVFSHEYDHALTDMHFGFSQMGVYPNCVGDEQRCRAIRALVEGDATLLMNLWWRQYASPQDYTDIENYKPPSQALPEQFPPPFTLRDGDLSYRVGYDFVKFLHDRGNWAEVNQAYTNLPQSTEQIMHPAKYLAGEAPMAVAAPPLTDTLGSDWQQIDNNSLGEWMTYLVLGYGADVAAQVDEPAAAKAAAGWGGDRYQIFYSDSLSATVLAAQWVWDTPADLKEFRTAIQFYLNERYRGAKIKDRTDGDCWEANNQATCLFVKNQATLWLVAPNQTILNAVLAQYPNFR
jgi:hypothetical protein